jgi:hypothetical protein
MAVGTTEIGSGAWPYDCAPQRARSLARLANRHLQRRTSESCCPFDFTYELISKK